MIIKQDIDNSVTMNGYYYEIETNDINKTYKFYSRLDTPIKYENIELTLGKIEKTLNNNFKNEIKDKNDTQVESNLFLLEVSRVICLQYKTENNFFFNSNRYNKLDKAFVKIENLINPPSALPYLSKDIILNDV